MSRIPKNATGKLVMPALKKLGLLEITHENRRSGFATQHIAYNPETQSIVATNQRSSVSIRVKVDGKLPYFAAPIDAVEKAGEEITFVTTDGKGVLGYYGRDGFVETVRDTPFPFSSCLRTPVAGDNLIAINPDVFAFLGSIQSAHSGTMCVLHVNAPDHSVLYAIPDKNGKVVASGVVMPMNMDLQSFESAIPASGKLAKSTPVVKLTAAPKAAVVEAPKKPARLDADLMKAAEKGSIKRVAELLQFKPDTSYTDNEGYNALTCAAMSDSEECLKLLLDYGFDVNHRPDSGVTALQTAACNGHYQCAKLLLDAGADPREKDADDWNAIEKAEYFKHKTVVALLKKAKVNK